jgi:hypothetical protein
MAEFKVRYGFRNIKDEELVFMAERILNGLPNNPAFPKPTVDLTTFQKTLDELKDAIAAQKIGGRAHTAFKHQKRDKLMRLIRMLAHYVEANHGGNLATLRSSGFMEKNPSRAQFAFPKTEIIRLLNKREGEISIQVRPIRNVKIYEIRCAAHDKYGRLGNWHRIGMLTNSCSLLAKGLTPLITYSFQVREIGGSTGNGDWSDPVSHICL